MSILAILGIPVIAGCAAPTGSDSTAPTVVGTVPIQGTSTAGIATNVKATFSEEMKPATIVAANFNLADGGSVAGTVTYDLANKTAIFAPTVPLAVGTLYTATVTTGAKDLGGNALAAAGSSPCGQTVTSV